jgi:hypothetical protein
MAYDGAEREVVLFGGAIMGGDNQTFLGDTWTWNGQGWTQLSPRHSPSARAYGQMAYDPVGRQVVLFGGLAGGMPLRDTWLWDGSAWTQAAPTFAPVATIQEGMTFFSGTGTVLLYSGNFAGPVHVYSWDGSNWSDRPFVGGPPDSAFQGGFSVDPERQVVVLLAHDVNQPTLQHWEFDGRTWTHRDVVTPPKRSLVQTATDERTGTIVMFGGICHNDTWTWDGRQWAQRHPHHSPSPRSSTGSTPGMAYDAAHGRVVVFGGIDFQTNVRLNDTWTWDGRDWRTV